MAGRVGDLAENRQIGRTREAVRVGLHEQVEGLLPISPRCRLMCALDDVRTHASLIAARPAVTVRVTAVTVLLTHLGWDHKPQANEEDPWKA